MSNQTEDRELTAQELEVISGGFGGLAGLYGTTANDHARKTGKTGKSNVDDAFTRR